MLYVVARDAYDVSVEMSPYAAVEKKCSVIPKLSHCSVNVYNRKIPSMNCLCGASALTASIVYKPFQAFSFNSGPRIINKSLVK